MCSGPKTCSALKRLCTRHVIRTFPAVEGPPSATGTTWSNSSCHRLSQRRPSSPRQAHWPPSRVQTSRRTAAGMGARLTRRLPATSAWHSSVRGSGELAILGWLSVLRWFSFLGALSLIGWLSFLGGPPVDG